MPDQITDLLDQIDRLDQAATKGPWQVTTDIEDDGGLFPWAIFGPKNDIYGPQGRDQENYIQEIPELTIPDAELIALSRTALPKTAKALRAVLAHLGQLEVKYDDYNAIDHIVHSITHELRQAITDALGADHE